MDSNNISLADQRQRSIDEFKARFTAEVVQEGSGIPTIEETPTFVFGYMLDIAQDEGREQDMLALSYLIEDREASEN